MDRIPHSGTPRQLTIALDAPATEGLEAGQRAEAVELLARLLLEAGGVGEKEDDDEGV